MQRYQPLPTWWLALTKEKPQPLRYGGSNELKRKEQGKQKVPNTPHISPGCVLEHLSWSECPCCDFIPLWESSHTWISSKFWKHVSRVFSRLNGSYEALKGGSTIEAMEDFTGGVGEMYEVKKAPGNFYEILEKALKRSSMVGCSIDVSKKWVLIFSA